MFRTLIIEDEPAARADLRALLAAHPQVAVVGEADTVGTARVRLEAGGYDLVFLDVNLIGGNGFDLVPFVQDTARIVFVTAYEQHAIRAFSVNALDYLLKPIAPARLADCLRRHRTVPAAVDPAVTDPAAPPRLRRDDQVFLKTGVLSGRFAYVRDIGVISSSSNYTEVALAGGQVLLVRRTLKEWETLLPTEDFARAHRTVIVNTARIAALRRASVAVTHVQLEGLPGVTKVSFRYLSGVRDRLAARGFT